MRRIFALVAAVLLLSGCGVQEALNAAAPTKLPAETEEAAVRVNGQAEPRWLWQYWLSRAEGQIAEEYAQAGEEVDWEAPTDKGTLRDCARRQALADTALCAVVDAWAEDWNCALTVEDQAQLDRLWTERAAEYGGEEGYLSHLKEEGLSGQEARALAETGQRYAKLHAEALSGGPHSPSEEELETFAKQEGLLCLDRILIAGEDKEAARRRAAELFDQLNRGGTEDFAALAAQGDDQEGPRLIRAGEGDMDPALEEAAACLAEGQTSGILESEEGCSILLRLPPEREALTAAWLDERLLCAAAEAEIQVLVQ